MSLTKRKRILFSVLSHQRSEWLDLASLSSEQLLQPWSKSNPLYHRFRKQFEQLWWQKEDFVMFVSRCLCVLDVNPMERVKFFQHFRRTMPRLAHQWMLGYTFFRYNMYDCPCRHQTRRPFLHAINGSTHLYQLPRRRAVLKSCAFFPKELLIIIYDYEGSWFNVGFVKHFYECLTAEEQRLLIDNHPKYLR